MKKLTYGYKLDTTLFLRVSKETKEKLEILSKEHNITKAEIVRQLVANYEEGEG